MAAILTAVAAAGTVATIAVRRATQNKTTAEANNKGTGRAADNLPQPHEEPHRTKPTCACLHRHERGVEPDPRDTSKESIANDEATFNTSPSRLGSRAELCSACDATFAQQNLFANYGTPLSTRVMSMHDVKAATAVDKAYAAQSPASLSQVLFEDHEPEPPTYTLRQSTVSCYVTVPSQYTNDGTVWLVGAQDSLGSWNVDNGIEMDRHPSDPELWTATLTWDREKHPVVEYKYVVRQKGTDSLSWETGYNRIFAHPGGKAILSENYRT